VVNVEELVIEMQHNLYIILVLLARDALLTTPAEDHNLLDRTSYLFSVSGPSDVSNKFQNRSILVLAYPG
jgi:hypothetical protein